MTNDDLFEEEPDKKLGVGTINAGDLEGNIPTEEFEDTIRFKFVPFEKFKDYEFTVGYGVMDYNGQIVIPPLFIKVTYHESEDYFDVFDHYGNLYKIDGTNWNCIKGDCADYRQLIRAYYSLIQEE